MSVSSMDDSRLAQNLGIYDRSVSDKEVADRILGNVKGIYSWVAVKTIWHQFQGTSGARETREITVRPSNWEGFCHLITLLWNKSDSGGMGVNPSRAVSAILGSRDPKDITHLRAAAEKKQKITICIAKDGEGFSFELAEIAWWCVAM